jgi:hypothetical protein
MPPKEERKIRNLISVGRSIIAYTLAFEDGRRDIDAVARFKDDCIDLLLSLGSPFSGVREEVRGIEPWNSTSDWENDHEGVPIRKIRVQEVDLPKLRRIVRLLIIAAKRLKAPAHEPSPGGLHVLRGKRKSSAGRKRGPKPRPHTKIAEIAHAYGEDWKDNLKLICAELDANSLPTPHLWHANWAGKPKTWVEALKADKTNVRKSLENSFKKSKKQAKPSR